jgi:hypothetical protein
MTEVHVLNLGSGVQSTKLYLDFMGALRTTGSVANRDMTQTMYVHRSCKPLIEIEFHPRTNTKELQLGFAVECEGMCGV